METVNIQLGRNKQADQSEGKSNPVVPPLPRRRPTNLEKAGGATGQQSLSWQSQPLPAAAPADMMEE